MRGAPHRPRRCPRSSPSSSSRSSPRSPSTMPRRAPTQRSVRSRRSYQRLVSPPGATSRTPSSPMPLARSRHDPRSQKKVPLKYSDPTNAPRGLPSPPITAAEKASRLNPASSTTSACWWCTKIEPENAARNPEIANAVSLARTGLTPYDSTAASLSRSAIEHPTGPAVADAANRDEREDHRDERDVVDGAWRTTSR